MSSEALYEGPKWNETDQWMPRAACRDVDPNIFFPTDAIGVDTAKSVCVICPVRALCLQYALRNKIDHGVWGGASEAERRQMLRQRGQ